MKATSIFGGVQVFNILITIIRSKLVAILLGPAGMGIAGLFTTTLGLMSSITNLGLARSAVRDVSAANATNDEDKISETVSVFRKLVWLTGGIGLIATLVLSPLLSLLTFGNYDYTFSFVFLSSTLLIGQLTVGQSVLLQGLRKITWLAKAGIYSAVIGLITSIPLYYLYGIKGIVPAILVSSVSVFFIQHYFAKRINIRTQPLTFKQAFQKGNGMIKLGIVLGLNGLISTGASYLIRIFISHSGSLEDVGLYTAGFAIINTYVGMVFSAMITDYYPRLAAVQQDNTKFNTMMNQQIEVALYIVSPLICAFLIFVNWIIILIYSSKFLAIVEMIQWGILAIFFKTLGWAIGVLVAAKGHSKHYFWNELTANIYLLIFNILGYYFFGLKGLGISFLVGYFIYFLQIYFFTKIKYGFNLEQGVAKQFVLFLAIGILCFSIVQNLKELPAYLLGGTMVIMVSAFSFYQLNKKTDMIKGLKNKIRKS
ncbi:oligosaccharide flippase family protein [Kaistella sp. BT6-1-3]|uniref:Oligosaccharide flippase family protein n=1 Tax=Kaistella yananensis TaxID=2989820 RepID=A0ABT3JJ19_9FLAO|nr:oligosaccharide flippase family protein [Kaistella yananensis]MCW4450783.1 oligosaccharide flippase family protein [Kaistella yananensis]